jgi:hypothetical protein
MGQVPDARLAAMTECQDMTMIIEQKEAQDSR